MKILCESRKSETADRKEEIMAILYANTRDASEKVTASQAILNGLAKHGGLYVPTEIPKLDIPVEELWMNIRKSGKIMPMYRN